ncbi:MAG: DUF4258 domain-containing protein [Sulfuricella sp.]|nr:DUF4258 domain-containing protein [Sulfuricella sp.]
MDADVPQCEEVGGVIAANTDAILINCANGIHYEQTCRRREISRDWISLALDAPGRVEKDREDPALIHALAAIPAHGNRVLRVIYNQAKNPPHVVTVYFDRTQKGTL